MEVGGFVCGGVLTSLALLIRFSLESSTTAVDAASSTNGPPVVALKILGEVAKGQDALSADLDVQFFDVLCCFMYISLM
ncbi:hypothetical protein Leryth_003765 [Lithospermum erythrorhizon]|nr:hypothetical protein Leryth_003765 [Lithospermum erythrorhizon]